MKRTVGKILLIVGGFLFLISSIYSLAGLIIGLVKAPEAYFGSGVGIASFVVTLLGIILTGFSGYCGIMYGMQGKYGGWIKFVVVMIIILFILTLARTIILSTQGQADWTDWVSCFVIGVPELLYLIGYFMDKKKA